MEFPWPKYLATRGSLKGSLAHNPSEGLFNGFDWVAQHLYGREWYMTVMGVKYRYKSKRGENKSSRFRKPDELYEGMSKTLDMPVAAIAELREVVDRRDENSNGQIQQRISALRRHLEDYGHGLQTAHHLRKYTNPKQGTRFAYPTLIKASSQALKLWEVHAGEWYITRENEDESRWRLSLKAPKEDEEIWPGYYVGHHGGMDIYKGRGFYSNYDPPRISLRDQPIVNPGYWSNSAGVPRRDEC